MSKVLSGIAVSLSLLVLFPACSTRTEVVALQPEARHRIVRVSEPVRTRTVQKPSNPMPSPASMEVVNAYDQ